MVLAETAAALQTQLNFTNGPMIRAALCHRGSGPARVLLVAHHLVIDVVSWGILVDDLDAAYEQVIGGQAAKLPPRTTPFKAWAERLQEYAASTSLRHEAEHWASVRQAQIAALPVDRREGGNTVASSRTLSVSLTVSETSALLQDVPRAYYTKINDALLTALARALAAWMGQPRVRVVVEGHGREPLFDDVDLSRTIGWFTTMHPVVLDLSGAPGPGDALRAIKEQLRRVPGNGIGYGLMRYGTFRTRPKPPAAAIGATGDQRGRARWPVHSDLDVQREQA
jgi:hypothetical protein